MKVETIMINRDTALAKLHQLEQVQAARRTKADDHFQTLYKAVERGARVINVFNAFRQTGLNELGEPRLAIARADHEFVFCRSRPYFNDTGSRAGTVIFTPQSRWSEQATARNFVLPMNTFDDKKLFAENRHVLKSAVPYIPPPVRRRMRAAAHNYHVLFEVESWERYPVDPFLMRRIVGPMFVVEDEWELTPLEASLLEGLVAGV